MMTMSSRQQATEEAKTAVYLILFVLFCFFVLCRGICNHRSLMQVQGRGTERDLAVACVGLWGLCSTPFSFQHTPPALRATRSFLSLGEPTECSFFFFFFLGDGSGPREGYKYGTFHEFSCHPSAGAMLIFVSFQF